MPFGDRQQQSVHVGEAQLTISLENRGGSLVIAFAGREQLHPTLSRPSQDRQGGLRGSMRRISSPKQRVGLADHFPDGAELPALAAAGLDGCDRCGVVLVGFRQQPDDRSGIEKDCSHASAVDHLVDFL